ncbi:helix-turn-helix domain-containing protein [Terribacillus saccharophilus]|uniref:helix-turn-helix domain-containing protein n=1 Tax=Terribacillus saccharophilus TaxID=361277 RepID=UPI003D2A5917
MSEERDVIDFRNRRFVQVTKSVINNDKVLTKPVDIAVYAVLCMYADNNTKMLHPKVLTIANKARCSESVARRSLVTLKEAGYIDIVPRFGKDGKQTSNQYVLLDVPDYEEEKESPVSSDTAPLV